MSSINPVFLMPNALAARAEDIGQKFVGSLTLGAGQFCTNPGLVFGVAGAPLDRFLAAAKSAVEASAAATMLTPGINKAYQQGVARLAGTPKVEKVGQGVAENGPNQGRAALFVTEANAFAGDASLSEEVFGAASLVIRCPDIAAMRATAERLEGQLTATIQMDKGDTADARTLIPILERRVGRILINGYPTGVEVCHAMVHGGPYPATSDGRTTSVGTLAIRRFLRPVCYQDFPEDLLPSSLRDSNELGLWRRRDGVLGQS
jgi:alpha-ketoglutaric semialdehyde dehydrogenase